MTSTQAKIHAYITTKLLVDDGQAITSTTPLFEGILDSLATLQLVSFVEENFHLTVTDGELSPDNFDTIERIATYVESKRSPARL
jgi:acyl carrier protein